MPFSKWKHISGLISGITECMHVEVVCSYDSRLHENGLFSDCSIRQIVNTYLHDKVDMIRSFLKRKKKNSLEREKKLYKMEQRTAIASFAFLVCSSPHLKMKLSKCWFLKWCDTSKHFFARDIWVMFSNCAKIGVNYRV